VRYLNDWTEFRQAFKEEYVGTLAESFRAGLPEGLDETARRIVEGVLSKRIPAILGIIESSSSTNETFVCSFTADASSTTEPAGDPGDRLSQWRGYSHSSQGFSLGFDRKLLKRQIELVNSPQAKADLLKCIYGDEEKLQFVQEMGHVASARFSDLMVSGEPVPSWFRTDHPNPTQDYVRTSYYLLKSLSKGTAAFFTKAARIKHIGFREEAEWRVIFQAHHDWLFPDMVRFRHGQFGPTPFIEIPLGLTKPETSSLRRIVVGPSTHKEDTKHSVELLLRKHGIDVRRPGIKDGVEVATSLIPYRSG
jgi:hypothetical protein